nr:MAG TPA: hypothetical protein [Caudoviricetes sp.]
MAGVICSNQLFVQCLVCFNAFAHFFAGGRSVCQIGKILLRQFGEILESINAVAFGSWFIVVHNFFIL